MRDLLILIACQLLLLALWALLLLNAVFSSGALYVSRWAVWLTLQHSPQWRDQQEAKRKARLEENF